MGNLPHLSDLELIDYIVAHVSGTGGDGLIHKDQARRLLELAGEKVPEELERQEFWQLDLKHPCFIRLTHEVLPNIQMEYAAKIEELKAELAQAVKKRDEARRELDEARVRIEDLENQVVELHMSL